MVKTFMFTSVFADHIALIAIVGGILGAIFNTVFESLLNISIGKETLNVKVILLKSLIAGVTVGLLFGVIFYASSVYSFPINSLSPIQLVAFFIIFFGVGNPLLGSITKLFYSRIFEKNEV